MMTGKTYQANEVVNCVDEGEDGAMLYNPDNDSTVLLNSTGRGIWAILSSPRTVDDIAGHLMASYSGITREQAMQDAVKFFESLPPEFLAVSLNES